MIGTNKNLVSTTASGEVLVAAPEPTKAVPAIVGDSQVPVPKTDKKPFSLKDNSSTLLAGAALMITLILFVFGRMSHHGLTHRSSPLDGKRSAEKAANNAGSGSNSILPITDTARAQGDETERSSVAPDDIARTAKTSQKAGTTNLGSIPPFGNLNSSEPPSDLPTAPPSSSEQSAEALETKNERDMLDKPSLVFVKNAQAPADATRLQETNVVADLEIGLPPGTRLRAHLESTVSTAVETPVVAVVEYNYERGGEVVVPAGTKVFGHLQAVDRTGYVGVRFDSMTMPDGTSVKVEASATDLRLRPLRGKVEGKKKGTNILVRSAAGLGEAVATLAGRGSLNQPLSEGDLLRERVSNNIAQVSDQGLNRLAISEHVVVSVPADTEIYTILQKPTSEPLTGRPNNSQPIPANSRQNVEQLRQLLQLQRELNQDASAVTSNQ